MNDLRDWPRNEHSLTGRFLIPTNCKCRMCEESLPWRLMIGLGIVLSVLIVALN